MIVRQKDDVSPAAAVAAVRTAGRDIFFAAEGYRPRSAVSGFYLDLCRIKKHFCITYGALTIVGRKN